MGFRAEEIALGIVKEMPGILALIKGYHDLLDQARRAATRVALNVSEGAERHKKDRELHFSYAAGSARELRSALVIAEAWGYVTAEKLVVVRDLIEQELKVLWRLQHPLPKR